MKKLLLFLISFCTLASQAQNLITPVSITLPSGPPANTADWATRVPPFMITAQAKLRNGQVPGEVVESRVLVTIRSGGNIVCGSYTAATAPSAGFTTAVKTWTGPAALALLGKDCILPPGSYEICVQFYALNPAAGNGLMGEACKTFVIEGKGQEAYNPPQNVTPADGKVFTAEENKQPVSFRWTPIYPNPRNTHKVTYRLRVVEVKRGQTAIQAVKSNSPLMEKNVGEQTQYSCCVTPIIVWPIAEGSKYAWYVEAEDEQGKTYGASQPTVFAPAPASVQSTPGQCSIRIDSVKATCKGYDQNGKPSYDFTIYYSNNAGAGVTNLGHGLSTNSSGNSILTPLINGNYLELYPVGIATLTSLTPANTAQTVVPGGNNTLQGTLTLNNAAERCITFKLLARTLLTSGGHTTGNECESISDTCLPACYCRDCELPSVISASTVISATTPVNASAAVFQLDGIITAGPNPIYSAEIQLESLNFSSNPKNCSNGITEVTNSGVISSPTVSSSSSGIVVYNTSPGDPAVTKGFKWKPAAAVSAVSGIPFRFNLGVPGKPVWASGNGANCCQLQYKACFKVTIEYAPCKYCIYYVCKEF